MASLIQVKILFNHDVEETSGPIMGDVKRKKSSECFEVIIKLQMLSGTVYFILQRKLIWKENLALLLQIE